MDVFFSLFAACYCRWLHVVSPKPLSSPCVNVFLPSASSLNQAHWIFTRRSYIEHDWMFSIPNANAIRWSRFFLHSLLLLLLLLCQFDSTTAHWTFCFFFSLCSSQMCDNICAEPFWMLCVLLVPAPSILVIIWFVNSSSGNSRKIYEVNDDSRKWWINVSAEPHVWLTNRQIHTFGSQRAHVIRTGCARSLWAACEKKIIRPNNSKQQLLFWPAKQPYMCVICLLTRLYVIEWFALCRQLAAKWIYQCIWTIYEQYLCNWSEKREKWNTLARSCVCVWCMWVGIIENDEHFLFEKVSQFTLASTLLHCCLVLACISSNCACSLFWVMVFRYNTTAYNSWKNI